MCLNLLLLARSLASSTATDSPVSMAVELATARMIFSRLTGVLAGR